MKKILTALLFIMVSHIGYSQAYDTTAPYKKDKHIPAFQILQTDSTWFKSTKLPKNKPVVIVYFSPECSHCQIEAEKIASHMEELKNAFFVMVSYHTPAEIKAFAEKYKLAGFSNVVFGRDTAYFLPSFFRVKFTPFIAVYNKKGELTKTYEMGVEAEELVKVVNGE